MDGVVMVVAECMSVRNITPTQSHFDVLTRRPADTKEGREHARLSMALRGAVLHL